MIEIYIFKENHRFSEQTRHPGLGSVVGAANLAAGRCAARGSSAKRRATEWRSIMFMVKFSLDGNWEVESTGSNNLSITNPTASYSVELNTWGEQPYVTIVEKAGIDGFSCNAFVVVRNNNGVREVFVTDNQRVGNNYATPLTEGARKSRSNTNPFIKTDGLPLTILGEALNNSARIQGKLKTGVCEVQNGTSIPTSPDAQNPRWVSFLEFSKTATDVIVKSVLFDFLMQTAKISGQNVGPSGQN